MPLWWNWYTRQAKDLCLNWRAGSSPVGGISKKSILKCLCGGIWYTRQAKDLCLNWRAGSSPVGGIPKTSYLLQTDLDLKVFPPTQNCTV